LKVYSKQLELKMKIRECSLGLAFAFFIFLWFFAIEIFAIIFLSYYWNKSSCVQPLKLFLVVEGVLGAGLLFCFIVGWMITFKLGRLIMIGCLGALVLVATVMIVPGSYWLSDITSYCDPRITLLSTVCEIFYLLFGLIFLCVMIRIHLQASNEEREIKERVRSFQI